MRPKAPGRFQKPKEDGRLGTLLTGKVEDEVGEDDATACPMVKHNFVERRCTAEEMLFDLPSPVIRCSVI
jgi:hypothetical protein